MKTLNVGLNERSYDIHIENGLISRAGEYIRPFVANGEKIAIISDENVWALYETEMMVSLHKAGLKAEAYVIPAGEESKSIYQLSEIYDWLGTDNGMNRKGLIIAFGGGVVGDIAGFAAATWMRGVNYVQIPTTLLAQVDSSIGGKTAIDTSRGKNLVGAFYQPKLVLIDTKLLETLTDRDLNSGMAEVIKYGAIASASLFSKLESTSDIKSELDEIIYECCEIKRQIVEKDEFDTGLRMILNFGHTFGHAIETKYDFEEYTHGEGVAQGMILAAAVGEELRITPSAVTRRLVLLAQKYGHVMPEDPLSLLEYMKSDKKASSDKATLILLSEIGQTRVASYDYAEIERVLAEIERVLNK